MSRAGFKPKVVVTSNLAAVRAKCRVPDSLASCHTTLVGDYVVEGHVPAEDVRRLLRDRPAAIGISAPGMPLGSPGMEVPSGARQTHRVMLFGPGKMSVFAAHGEGWTKSHRRGCPQAVPFELVASGARQGVSWGVPGRISACLSE
jgi:hypothetical protein